MISTRTLQTARSFELSRLTLGCLHNPKPQTLNPDLKGKACRGSDVTFRLCGLVQDVQIVKSELPSEQAPNESN